MFKVHLPQDLLPENSPEARGQRFQDRINQWRQLHAARTPPSEPQGQRAEVSADSAPPPFPDRPWLTVEEAAAYSGLPANYLLRQIEDGRLAAIDVGIRPGGRYHRNRSYNGSFCIGRGSSQSRSARACGALPSPSGDGSCRIRNRKRRLDGNPVRRSRLT
jgi:excisionase family DNA binding protein